MWTDNPERDLMRYQADQERQLQSRPICDLCGEHIQQETAVHLYYKDWGQLWCCDSCLDEMREHIEEE